MSMVTAGGSSLATVRISCTHVAVREAVRGRERALYTASCALTRVMDVAPILQSCVCMGSFSTSFFGISHIPFSGMGMVQDDA